MGVLGVAGVVCCAAGVAGDMIQDLKVGHILGGTPWKMQVGEIIGVSFAGLVLVFFLDRIDKVYVIGSAELPAPQAGLMALMAKGIRRWGDGMAPGHRRHVSGLCADPDQSSVTHGNRCGDVPPLPLHSSHFCRWDHSLASGSEPGKAKDGYQKTDQRCECWRSPFFPDSLPVKRWWPSYWPSGWDSLKRAIFLHCLISPLAPWAGMLIFLALLYLLVRVPLKAAEKGGAPDVRIE